MQPDGAGLAEIAGAIARGEVRPVVDRVYPLERAGEAQAYLEEGHARGKVILSIADDLK